MRILWKNKETMSGLAFFLLSVLVLREISAFPATGERIRSLGPEFFPRILSVGMGLLSIALFVRGLFLPAAPLCSKEVRENSALPALMILLGVIAFILLLDIVGFPLFSALFLLIIQYVCGERSVLRICGAAVVISCCLYVIFAVLLKISLPNGVLFL